MSPKPRLGKLKQTRIAAKNRQSSLADQPSRPSVKSPKECPEDRRVVGFTTPYHQMGGRLLAIHAAADDGGGQNDAVYPVTRNPRLSRIVMFISQSQESLMSRTIKFTKAGAPEVLEFVERDVAAPGAAEVRIKVKAIGINRAESMWRQDAYIEPVKFPAGLGYEAAGIVDALGSEVAGLFVGDEVSVIPSFSMNEYTTYGEVVVVPAYAVVKHPKSLSFAEAASIWMMFVTAYGALIEDAKVTAGDFVIIPAASSSVGLAAIQLVNFAGGASIALTRTSEKRKQLIDAGASHVIATEEADLVKEVMRITDGRGARVAFDPVGGPNFPKLISALAFQGVVYIYGALAEGVTPLPLLEMIAKMPTIKAHNIWLTSGDEARRKAAVAFITRGLETGALKPVIDRTYKFGQMVEVHRYLETNGQFGKIVVTV
jgi:NADPH:quinone reductase-like Zn-dependent oxidoreductase